MNCSTRKLTLPFILLILLLLGTACAAKQDPAQQAIEKYLTALADKDSVQLSNLSCNAWQPDAQLELDSLAGVGSKLENLACQRLAEQGSDVSISCSGILALDYNGEAQQIDLSTRTYLARQEDGEWRMCGYR